MSIESEVKKLSPDDLRKEIPNHIFQRRLCILITGSSTLAGIVIVVSDVLTKANNFSVIEEIPGVILFTSLSALSAASSNSLGHKIHLLEERSKELENL